MKRVRLLGSAFLLGTLATLFGVGCSDDTTSGVTTTASSSSSGQAWVPTKIVINEMHAVTEDWVEIVNVDTVVADLGGVGLVDKDAAGAPNLDAALRFPEGTQLKPGEYVIVVVNMKDAAAGPQTTCLMSGGPATCYQAKWGISSANGDRVYLLSPTDEVVDAATYPVNAVADGQSYCRLPDGSGGFQACAPTPGAVNAAP